MKIIWLWPHFILPVFAKLSPAQSNSNSVGWVNRKQNKLEASLSWAWHSSVPACSFSKSYKVTKSTIWSDLYDIYTNMGAQVDFVRAHAHVYVLCRTCYRKLNSYLTSVGKRHYYWIISAYNELQTAISCIYCSIPCNIPHTYFIYEPDTKHCEDTSEI